MTRSHWMGLTRIILSPIACGFLIHDPNNYLALVSIILLAIVTDILDGYWARKFKTVSTFGVYLDVVADKVFMCPLLFILVRSDPLLTWCAVLVLLREFLVMGLRTFAASQLSVIPAEFAGKLKTIILFPALLALSLDLPVAKYLVVLGTFAAILSLCSYVYNSRHILLTGLYQRNGFVNH